ncbi:hypothetical protein D3C73_1056600 [compost metagenome]
MRQFLRATADRELPVDIHTIEAAGMTLEEQRHARVDQAPAAGLGQRSVGESARAPATDRNQRAQMRMTALELGQCGEVGRRLGSDRTAPVLDGGKRIEQMGEPFGRDARYRIALGRTAGVVRTEDRRLRGLLLRCTGQGAGDQHCKYGHGLAEHGNSRVEGAATLANRSAQGADVRASRPPDSGRPLEADTVLAA